MQRLVNHSGLFVMQTEFSVYVLLRLWIYLIFHPNWDGSPQDAVMSSHKFFQVKKWPFFFIKTRTLCVQGVYLKYDVCFANEIRAAMTDLTRAFTSFSRLSAFFINKFEAKHHFCSKNFVRLFLFCSVVFKF